MVRSIVVMALVAALSLAACAGGPQGAPTTSPAPTTAAALPPVTDAGRVVADAVVVPQRKAQLSLPVGGVVAQVLVQEGQSVAAGDVILRLEAARQAAGAAQAEAALRRAQAQLDQLKAGPRPEEVETAQAAVDAAQAQLDRLHEGARAEEVAAAQAALDAAQAALQKVREGPQPGQLIAAEADLANAEATLRQAQAAYDKVAGDPDIGRLLQSVQLEQATNAYNAAKARLEDLKRGATQADLAAAQAQVRQAQAQLDMVKALPRASDLAAAQAELRRAQAQLDLLLAGPRPEAIAAAEADVSAAQAALADAQAALADTELRAPFAGVIVELVPAVGELVGAGQPLAQLANLSAWQVETDDLNEFAVVRIRQGAPATVQFDALPGLSLPGTVAGIQAIGKTKQGDVTYKVTVVPSELDPRLYWGMSAQVNIDTQTP